MKIDAERLQSINRRAGNKPGDRDEYDIQPALVTEEEIRYMLAIVEHQQQLLSDLWPFIRYFALCGACPEAINAVAATAEALGIDTPATDAAVMAQRAAAAKADEIAGWLENGPKHRMIPRQYRDEIAKAVREMGG